MSTKKSLLWSFIQEYSAFLINFVTSLIMARLLTPAQFGIFAIGVAICDLMAMIRQFGVGRYIVQTRELTADRLRSALGVMMLVSFFFGLLLLLLGGPIGNLYGHPELAPVLAMLAASFFLVPFSQTGMALLERRLAFRQLMIIGIASALLSTVVSVGSALAGHGVMSLAYGSVALQSGYLMGVLLVRPPGQVFVPSLRQWREVLRFGSYVSAQNVIAYLSQSAPTAIIGKLLDATSVGLYSRAVGLVSMLRQLLTAAITRIMYPTFARLANEDRSLDWSYIRALEFNTLVVWSALAVLGIVATPVVSLLYGERWAGAGHALSYLCVALAIQVSVPFYVELMFIRHREKALLVRELCIGLFTIANFTFWASRGIVPAAASRIVDALLLLVVYLPMMLKLTEVTGDELIRVLARNALVLGISIIPVTLTMQMLGWPDRLPPLLLILLAPMSMLAWLVGMMVTNHRIAGDIWQVVQAIRSRVVAR